MSAYRFNIFYFIEINIIYKVFDVWFKMFNNKTILKTDGKSFVFIKMSVKQWNIIHQHFGGQKLDEKHCYSVSNDWFYGIKNFKIIILSYLKLCCII